MTRRKTTILLAVVFCLALLISAVSASTLPTTASAKGCDARCWYVKYKQEKRKSARLARQRGALAIQVRILRRQADPLTRSAVPWVRLKKCETRGYPGMRGWRYNGDSGFDGGIQFSPGTWRSYGGLTFSKYAHGATPIQQVAIGQKVLSDQGRGAWPGCTAKGAW